MQQDVATNLKELNRLLRNRKVFSSSWRTGRDTWPERNWVLPRPGSRLFVSVREVSDPIVKRSDKSWSWGGATGERLEWGRPKSSGKSEFWKLLEAWQGCCTREDKSGVRTRAEVDASKLKGRKERLKSSPSPCTPCRRWSEGLKTRSRGEANA